MTSTNDGKDVKSNQTSGHKGKSYYIDLYKSLEKHLSEECELRERTQHLCSAWRRVHSLCQHSAHTTHPHYLAWLQRHTANTLLLSEWQSEKDEHANLQNAIDSYIAESKAAAVSRNGHSPAWETQLVQRGEWFKKILGNPWGHPVLKVLCDPRGEPPSDDDILEWLKEERGVMFVTRLRHLAASKKCHEIALSLATAVMDRKRACETIVSDAEQTDGQEPSPPEGSKPTFKDILRTEAGFTVDVWEVLTDLEFVLLHKRNEHSQCIALAKKIPLRSGYQLVERLRSRPETSPREKKLWKNAGDVATLVAQVLITRCMVVGACAGVVRSALYCCARSLVRLLPAHALPAACGALAAPAATARHLHTLAAAVHTQLHAQHAQDMNSFVCELYVRAITAGMNELEKLKLKTEKEPEARNMEQTLASWFTSLGSLLSCSARIHCECALTAFSVHPSAAMYDKISAAPPLPSIVDKQEPKEETKSEFGSWASDSRSQTNLVKTSETLNLKQTQQHTNVMSTAIFAEGEAIGLSAELCQDLTVCLSGPRVKTLSWDMDREALLENCRTYMERTHSGTRALTTELKYLNLDPSQYQHLPEEDDDENDVYYGIEKGYEHLVELQEEVGWQENIFDHEATETAYSSEELDEMPVRRKKKTKRVIIPPSEVSDPLSTVTESNKGDKKKERPHSKERSKEKKKKSKNPEDKEKRKEKKERKKKEKVAKPGSLASLIGVRVSKQDGTELGLTITDSDYDSQGKSSLASEGNDPNVVFDGLFNMDDPLSDKPLLNSEMSVVNGQVAVNKAPKRKPSVNKKKSKSSTNVSMTETKPIHRFKSVTSLLNLPPKPPRPSAVGVVSEQVKRSITKLLQFRRNQNSVLAHKNTQNVTPKVEHKPLNAIYKPEFSTQQFSPKSVIVPEIPKSFINKAQLERLDPDRSPPVLVNQTLTYDSIGHAPIRSDSDRQHNILPVQSHNKRNSEVIIPPVINSPNLCRPTNKYKEILNIPNYYQNMTYNLQHSPNILSKNHSPIPPKNISMSLSRVETPRPQEHSKSYEDFLIDLKTAANPMSPSMIAKKDVRPISQVSPVMPSLPYTDISISQQCAKQVSQKKAENAPNTFSRLSYMKNKQSDLKHKQALETQASRQEEWSHPTRTALDSSRCLTEFKNTKIKYIKTTKGETVITRVDNPLNLSCDNANVVRKTENNTSTSRSHPVMANILQSTTSISQMPVSRYDSGDTTKVTTPPTKTSYLSEKDQNDLLLILRQQNRINAVRNVSRNVPPCQQVPINMTMDNASNMIASPNVVSKPVQSTSLINNNLQYANTTEGKETKHLEIKQQNHVISISKNATPSGRGNKKVSKTSVNERNYTPSKPKLESDSLDWEKVMNAIRAQKTPSREHRAGPSALELALKNSLDSSDKSLRNQRIVRTNSVGETDKITKTVDAIIGRARNVNTPKTSGISFPQQSSNKDVVKTTPDIKNKSVITKTAQTNVQNTSIELKKSVKNLPLKRPSGEVNKKQIVAERNKFATTISKNKDPFISGREEDYNLSDLDDLLDDELRRELGELSSDEDSYRIPQASKGIKIQPCTKSNSLSKQSVSSSDSLKEKNEVPNLPHSLNNQYQQDEMPVSNCNYSKSKECVRSHQTNKTKIKASVHNSPQHQSISKATSNENLNKSVPALDKPVPQVTDLNSRCQNTMSSKSLNKNVRKVSNPNLRYQNSTVNKDMLNEAANNHTTNPCIREQCSGAPKKSTSIVEETRKVYVVPTVVQPPSNIVLLGSQMYFNSIPNMQNNINSDLCDVNPIFLQQNDTITMPQPAYCVPSVSGSCISTTNVSVNTPMLVNVDKTSHVTNKLNSSIASQSQFVPSETMNDNRQDVVKSACPKTTIETDQRLQDNITNLDNNVIFDINSNKNPEQSVLSEVGENKKYDFCDTTPKLSRRCSISTEEVLRDILNDQEAEQTVTNDLLIKNSVTEKVINDKTEPLKDTERLKRKRLAIINRQIIHSCSHPPIALSYVPLLEKITHIDAYHKKSETTIDTRKVKITPQEILNSALKDNDRSIDGFLKKSEKLKTIKKVVEVKPQEIVNSALKDDHSKDGNLKNSDKFKTIKKVVEVIAEESIKSPLLINHEEVNNEHSKENTSNTITCRRIMLRSSNKNLPKIPADVIDQNPIARKTKVRLKVQSETDQTKMKEDINKQKSDEDGKIESSKTNHKKKVKRKTPVTKNKSKKSVRESKKLVRKDKTEVCMSGTLPMISSDSFDVEDALLGSMIPNIKLVHSQSISASEDSGSEKSKLSTNKADNIVILHNKKVKLVQSQSTSLSERVVDEKSNVKANKVAILQNKNVTLRRKRKSSKIMATNNDVVDDASKTVPEIRTEFDTGMTSNPSDNHRITRSVAKTPIEKQIQKISQLQMADVTADINCLNKTIVTNRQQTNSLKINPVHINDATKQEQSNGIVNNVTNKTQISGLDKSTNTVKSQTKDILPSGEEKLNKLSEMTTNKETNDETSQKVDKGVKNIESKTFQSILEKFIVTNNQVSEEPKQSEPENCQQTNDRKVHSSTDTSNNIEVHQVASDADANKSALCSSNIVTPNVDENNKILHEEGLALPSNAVDTRSSNVVPPNDIGSNKMLGKMSQLPTNADSKSSPNTVLPNVSDRIQILRKKTQLQSNEKNKSINLIDSEKCNIPQSYKDSIIIEEIPNEKGSDVTKLLRVKLPNGKIFKASVYGKMHTSFDSLFQDPSLRAMLMSDLNEQRKYTLNIKQVSKTSRENPGKPIETRIQEIQVKTKNLAPAVVETIDLLSDDEENDDICQFKTSSGIYKTNIIDKDIVAKHQAMFDKKCCVKLERLVLPSFHDCPDDSRNPDVIEIDGDFDNIDEISSPPVVLNTLSETVSTDAIDVQNIPFVVPINQNVTTGNKQNHNTNIIDVDDSSNDSIDLLKNCPDLPVELISGVPLISNDSEILEDINNGIVGDSSTINNINKNETRLDGNIDTAAITSNKNKVQTLDGTTDITNKNLEMSSINIDNESNTSDVAEITNNQESKILDVDTTNQADSTTNNTFCNREDNNQTEAPETFIKPKCISTTNTLSNDVSQNQCDANQCDENQCDEFLKKPHNCYVSLTRCDDLVEFYNIQNTLSRRCSVSLERCDSAIESLKCFEELDTSIDTSDAEMSSVSSISILNEISFFSEKNIEGNVVDGRNSPVIEVFEVIAYLRKKIETDKEVKMTYYIDKFECEWLLTKQQIHFGCKCIEFQEYKNDHKKSCIEERDDLFMGQQQDSADVPSLVSLLTLFFQNQNSSILDQLKPVSKKPTLNRLNIRKCSAFSLKRKMPKLADNIIASKVSKSVKTEVLFADKANSVVLSECQNNEDEDIKTLTIPSDAFKDEDKSVIIENENHYFTLKDNTNPRLYTHIPDLTSKKKQRSKTEKTDGFNGEDAAINSINSDSSVNIYTELAPKEIKDFKIEKSLIKDIILQYEVMEIDNNVNTSKLHECQDFDRESEHEVKENVTNDDAENILNSNSQCSKTSENVDDVAQKQDILEVDIIPNQTLQMDELIDLYNDKAVSMNANLSSTDEISTSVEGTGNSSVTTANITEKMVLNLNQQYNDTIDVKNSQSISSCVNADSGENKRRQHDLTDIVKINDDKRLHEVEIKTSQVPQTDEKVNNITSPCQQNSEHLDNDVISSIVRVSSELSATDNRKFDNTVEAENFHAMENTVNHFCEVDNINQQRSENVIEELSLPISVIAKTDHLGDKQSQGNVCSEIKLYEDVNNKQSKENSILDLKRDHCSDLIDSECLKDVVDIEKNINELDKTTNEAINDEQLVRSTVFENFEVDHCDSTTSLNICSNENRTDPEIADIENNYCIALEVTCGDAENIDNDHISLSVGELISDEIKDKRCDEIIQKAECMASDEHDNNIVARKIPDHEYDLRQAPNETTEVQTLNEIEINEKGVDNVIPCSENHVLNEEEADNQHKRLLRGVEIEDPDVGILYVLYPIDDSTSESGTPNGSCDDITETFEEIEDVDDVVDNSHGDRDDDKEIWKVNIPKTTYSKQPKYGLRCKHNLKRKTDFSDSKFTTKRYRKGKNIDYPKITAAAILEQGYAKEYKRVLDYSSSLKFSYTQPFHKDYLDMDNTIKDWPIKGPCVSQPELDPEFQCVLFTDTEPNPIYEPKALEQTLVEEINQNYAEKNEPSSDINEINFNMGFGEGSGRVIQNLEDVGDISKVSAATLSDVKQPQPFLLSEDCKYICKNTNAANDDQIEKIQRYFTYIKLRDRVKTFFQKNFIELNYDGLSKKKEEVPYNQTFDSNNFPFDLYIQDFMEPRPFQAIVQVVQVGQLPVSAAAQNPVTCDPRVTQVSNASPSQCSAENSPHDESSTPIKTEYTELTTADLSLPLVQDYAQHTQTISMNSHENQNIQFSDENIPIETEIKSVVKIELTEEMPEDKEQSPEPLENTDIQSMEVNNSNTEYSYETNNTDATYETNNEPSEYETTNTIARPEEPNEEMLYNSNEKQTTEDDFSQEKHQNGSPEKTDQIAHAMSAAGITTTSETIANNRAHALVNILSQKFRQGVAGSNTTAANSYPKTTSINAMALQQALAQILPPPLNQTNVNDNNQQTNNTQVTPQVLHIVQGKNASGSQITLVDNSQQSVISGANATPVLHIVQNKSGTPGATTNGAPGTQTNSFSGLSLVDAGLQQGGNQLLHIVNTGNQKNNNAGQLLKRVNLLTNLANVQGSNEQKMVQFVCKSADGKSIQLNAPHQRSMVLRLQPIESPVPASQPKPTENQELSQSPSASTAQNKDSASQQEIKSRSVYEENYAKFIQNSSTKPAAAAEKSTSLPKFNQAFGKPVFQDGTQKTNEITNNMPSVNTPSENSECPPTDNNNINLEHIRQISSPPLLLRKSPGQTSQAQTNLVQQIKQSIAPMNIQTMHGGVIYTRQIPVNIGGGQTINLITVPSTELIDETCQKQQSGNQGEIESSIIKIVPQTQSNINSEISAEDNGNNMGASNENNQNQQPQPQPVLTQMRIKLPMLSKTPQMVSGTRVVRPSFFQIQRNVIGGANQPVYQQLVLTAAPPLGQQTIRLPTAQANRQPLKVPSDSQSTESMSSSTLEQLREFDMVLEQVKERSTVQPNTNTANTFPKLHTPSSDTTDTATSVATTPTESSQVLYSIGNNQQLNVAYVNRKTTVSTPTTSTFVRSPDSSGIADSPTSTAHVQIPHTVTTESTSNETSSQPKPAKVGSKSKSRPKSSSHPPNSMKINPVPPKTSTQKPLEDEQTTQRILYILAEYKEQVENSPDKDKPAPRRRSNPPSNPGSSKRKKSSSGSRRHGGHDMSPVHGEDTCRTMGSEDSSCGTSQGDCNESCLDSHSPQDSPRKIVRKLTFEHETPVQQPRPQPQRNVIVADGQTITVARGTAGKPATAVLMPANYILPVSMVKGGQQIAIVTNRGPKLLTVGGEGGATNALLLQRLIGPAGLKPVLARPGVRHVRLPTAALHNLQAFNLAAATTVQPPDSTASPAPAPTPPELVETRATSSPWADRESQDVKPERGSSPEGSEPWNLPSSADPQDYTYEETVRAENMDRTVLDAMPDRYSPDMEAQRIFDKMFDVDSKKSYIVDSPRCGYDIDASDCDDKAYHQVVQKKDGTSQRHHRLTHVSAAALRHKYAILEHELRLQKSLSEECEDLGVDSPSASELFPEAELLFAASPAHDHTQDQGHQSHTPQPAHANQQSSIPQPDMDDQIATDQLLPRDDMERQQLELGLEDVGIVGVGGGMQHAALDHEEFARAHPNTTFHSEPTDDAPVQPFTIAGLKGRHITSTIFHSNRAPATVLMTAPQTTVISQATAEPQNVKYNIDHMINSLPSSHNINLSSVLVKDDGLTRFDSILNDSRELHLTHTASAVVHSTGNATQVIRRVCYDDKRDRDNSFLMDEPDALIAGDDAKMIAEDSSRDATLESMADVDDDRSSPERHTELFWESNSASERSESRRPLDFSSDSDKCCKSPSYDETNSTDSSGVGTHMRLDSVIKDARGIERSGSADGSSADDTHPPLRTYPPKRVYHPLDGEMERSLTGKTRAGERSPDSLEVRRRASGRGVVKRGCHCCNGSPAPPRPKKARQRKPTMDFNTN